MNKLPVYKVQVQGNLSAKWKVLHRNFLFLIGYADKLDEKDSLAELLCYAKEDSFYSTDEEQEYEDPVTCSKARGLVKQIQSISCEIFVKFPCLARCWKTVIW